VLRLDRATAPQLGRGCAIDAARFSARQLATRAQPVT
jgi:hypothetical protein